MFDIRQKVFTGDEMDEELVENYREELMEAFSASPEAQPVIEKYGDVSWADTMMEYGFGYIGVSPAEMSRSDFEEILFDLFPRKVSTDPETADEIIDELRAFWNYILREYRLTNARKILPVLDDRAAGRLRRALGNPANFGMAKSFFMMGQEAGYDMTTPEGLDAFTAAYNGSLGMPPLLDGLPPPDEEPAIDAPWDAPLQPSPLTNAERKKKRQQRKAQRKARKRNRK